MQSTPGKGRKGKSMVLPELRPNVSTVETESHQSPGDDSSMTATPGEQKAAAKGKKLTIGSSIEVGMQLHDSVECQAGESIASQLTLYQAEHKQLTVATQAKTAESAGIKGKERENAADRIEEIMRERDQARAECERIQRALDGILRERDDAKIEIGRLQGTMEKMLHERGQTKIDSDRHQRIQSEKMIKLSLLVQSERGSNAKKIGDLENEASSLRTRLEAATTATTDSTARIEILGHQISVLRADLDDSRLEASKGTSKLETENHQLASEMAESRQTDRKRIETLESDISSLQAELDDTRRGAELKIDTLRAENLVLREELATRSENISIQEERSSIIFLGHSREEVSALQDKLVMSIESEALKENIAVLRDKLAERLREGVITADRIGDLQRENASMADEIKSLRLANELISADLTDDPLTITYGPGKPDENLTSTPTRRPPSPLTTSQPDNPYPRAHRQLSGPDMKPMPPTPRKPVPRPRPTVREVPPPTPQPSPKPASIVPKVPKPYQLYVRWITVELAVRESRLRDIPTYITPLSSDITINDLRVSLLEKTHVGRMGHGSRNSTIELFANSFHVSTVDHRAVTLADLGLKGTAQNPADVCLVYLSDTSRSSMDMKYTARATATFRTCLRILLTHVRARNCLVNLLEVVWEVTHFPPAVIAFKELYEKGDEVPLPCAIAAGCIRVLVQTVVPGWKAESPETSLEFSRPIFAGIYSQTLQRHERAAWGQAIVRSATLAEVTEASGVSTGDVNIDVCQMTLSPSGPTNPNSRKTTKNICVYREAEDDVESTFLALAKWGRYDGTADYYFYRPEYLSEEHTYPLRQNSFRSFLDSANRVEEFRVVGPQQLGSLRPPCITLNGDGYVSVYDLKSVVCGEVYPSIWNAVSGEQSLADDDPGQFLLQALQPVIGKRQKDNSWEVDAWAVEQGVNGGVGSPEEGIVICVDRSGSMTCRMALGWDMEATSSGAPPPGLGPSIYYPPSPTSSRLSRMSEVKELFGDLVARMAAYKLPTHLGLLTTPATPGVDRDPTPVLYDIKDKLESITATGCERICSTLNEARQMLVTFQQKHPRAKLRIIFLSDGECYEPSAPETCQALCAAGVVVDSIFIGEEPGDTLFKMSKFTGGYAFHPEDRTALFQIPLLESFVDIRRRPDIQRRAVTSLAYTSAPKPAADFRSRFDCLPARPHPHQNDEFVPLKHAAHLGGSGSAAVRSSGRGRSSGGSATSGREHILLGEVRLMAANPHPYMDVYISESNIGFWKVVMQGPPDSPYAPGVFVLFVDIGESYPRQPPNVEFITPMLHPNITKQGRICHPIFDREWDPKIRVYEVLQQVWGMLMVVETRDSVDPIFTMKIWTDPEGGQRDIADHVRRFAL